MKTCTAPERQQTTGVNAPRQNAPASMTMPISHMAIETVGSAVLLRTSIPAAQTRKSRSPQPAAPAGNIENSLCTHSTVNATQLARKPPRRQGRLALSRGAALAEWLYDDGYKRKSRYRYG